MPDFVKLADAYGCAGLRCERAEDVDDTIRQALAINDRPVVVDFVVCRDAMVWPMVPAGCEQRRDHVCARRLAGVGPRVRVVRKRAQREPGRPSIRTRSHREE